MLRKSLALFLITMTFWSACVAQTAGAAGPSTPDNRTDHPAAALRTVKLARREGKVRRGHDSEFAFAVVKAASDCLECLPVLIEEGDRVSFTSVILAPLAGFTYQYPDNTGKFEPVAIGFNKPTKAGQANLVKVRPDKKLAPGTYFLTGKLTVHILESGSRSSSKEIDLSIPVEVVDENTSAAFNPWPYEIHRDHHMGQKIVFVLLFPVFLFWAAWCETTNCMG